mmetsp:Transcript_10/g.29  ORF Transcript_10/g.29 Transcript_10/m.29 type:complete len:111 (+) Transcript_10:263-595(+)
MSRVSCRSESLAVLREGIPSMWIHAAPQLQVPQPNLFKPRCRDALWQSQKLIQLTPSTSRPSLLPASAFQEHCWERDFNYWETFKEGQSSWQSFLTAYERRSGEQSKTGT